MPPQYLISQSVTVCVNRNFSGKDKNAIDQAPNPRNDRPHEDESPYCCKQNVDNGFFGISKVKIVYSQTAQKNPKQARNQF